MVKFMGRLRKKKSTYVEVDTHSKVYDAVGDKNTEINNKSLKEGDREQLGSLSTRSMSTLQKSRIPWTKSEQRTARSKSVPTVVDDPISKIASRLAANPSPKPIPQDNRSFRGQATVPSPSSNTIPHTQSPPQKVHPPVSGEVTKANKKAVSKFEEEALNAKYDLIPTKVRNAPFGRCYFARHRESKNVVLVALILQHVFDRFQGEHGEVQLIELMKSADPNLLGLREKIECTDAVALVMDITLSELTKSQTVPVHNGAAPKPADPSLALDDAAERAMDQRDEEDEIEDFMSELDSNSPKDDPPKNMNDAGRFHTQKARSHDDDMREKPEDDPEAPKHSTRQHKVRKKEKEQGQRRRKAESSERRRSRDKSRGRHQRVTRRDSPSTYSSGTSVEPLRPQPPKNLTFWKLLTSLEMADCMPLAALDETMDYNYGRRGGRRERRQNRDIGRRNTFDNCESRPQHY
ncbi:MAG: hypothetical protein SGBAC_005621 [Bacillariaceae sp.]